MAKGHEMRLITRENERGDRTEIAYIKVVAVCGEGIGTTRQIECRIDPVSGRIVNLPELALWTGINNADDIQNRKNRLVRRFHIEVGHAVDAPVVVAQRAGNTNRYRPAGGELRLGEELVSFQLAPCDVTHWVRSTEERAGGLSPVAVWTDPMNAKQGGSNRVDLWCVDADGTIALLCIYVVTLDDGKTWSVVQQERWTGQVWLRQPGTMHELLSTDSRVTAAFHSSDDVRNMLNKYVFVPGEHSENFEKRMQILANPKFRELVSKLESLPTWEKPIDFWLDRDPGTDLRDDQGVIQFLTWGVGRGSMGIIKLKKPILIGGIKRDTLQFEHTAVIGDLRDEQGIMFLAPGTIADVNLEQIVNMDKGSRQYPPKAMKVIPRTIPVPFEPAKASAAA